MRDTEGPHTGASPMTFRRAIAIAYVAACLTVPETAAQEPQAPATRDTQTWEINARDQDIRQFITQVSQITGRPFVVDSRLKGTVTVVSTTALDPGSVYELLLSVLRVHGYGAYSVGDVVHVVQNPTLVKQTGGGGDNGLSLARQAIVTQVVPAQNVAAAELVKILRPLIPQYGHVAAVAQPNVVILSDHADNIERLLRIVTEIDVANESEFVVRPLTHAWVGSVVEILEKVAPEQLGEGGAGPQVVQVIANERNNSLILRGKSRPVAVITDLVDKLDIPATATDAAQVIRLAHAQAVDVVGILTGLFVGQAGDDEGHINIQADDSLNAVVARADPGTMGEILDVLTMLDVRRTQVLIEAAIAEVAVDDLFTLGAELAGADQRGQSVPAFNTTLNGIVNELLAGALPEGATAVDGVGLVTRTTTPGLAVAKVDPEGISFGAVLNALATNVAADLLSAPSVLTLDNEEAKNLVGQNVPFRSGSFSTTADGISNPFSAVQRQDIGITLTVTPHVHDGTSVRLEVLLTVENLVDSGLGASGGGLEAADLITQKREVETTVLADDGQTIVLGGLIQDDIRQSRRKVPLLGDIPAVGRLFRSNRETRAKRNLLVFLRPTVLRSEADVQGAADRLYDRIREFRLEPWPADSTTSPDAVYDGRRASTAPDGTGPRGGGRKQTSPRPPSPQRD